MITTSISPHAEPKIIASSRSYPTDFSDFPGSDSTDVVTTVELGTATVALECDSLAVAVSFTDNVERKVVNGVGVLLPGVLDLLFCVPDEGVLTKTVELDELVTADVKLDVVTVTLDLPTEDKLTLELATVVCASVFVTVDGFVETVGARVLIPLTLLFCALVDDKPFFIVALVVLDEGVEGLKTLPFPVVFAVDDNATFDDDGKSVIVVVFKVVVDNTVVADAVIIAVDLKPSATIPVKITIVIRLYCFNRSSISTCISLFLDRNYNDKFKQVTHMIQFEIQTMHL